MKKAKLIPVDGSEKTIEPENGENFELKEMYDLIGCKMIQFIELSNSDYDVMVIDEEGKNKDHHLNHKATNIARGSLFAEDYIAGTAIVCRNSEVQ